MKKIFLLLFACYSLYSASAQNINLSNSPYWDGECYLTANPKNPKHLVSAWMYFSTSNLENTIATRSSFDGGKTWSTLQKMPHVSPKFTCADPTMYFGKDSCVYLAYIDLSGLKTSDSGYIMVTRSVNGGITWKTPVKAISYKAQPNIPIDRPWIAADASTGPYSGRVYLTSQNAYFTPQPHYPWFTYSSDSGATWAPIKRLDDSIPTGTITDATAFTTVSANGTLYAAYASYATSYSLYPHLVVIKSSNGGTSFTPYIAITYTTADAIPTADSLVKSGLCIQSNPADTTNLVILETTNRFGEPDIASYNSHNAGKTWSGPVRINDDQMGAYDTTHDLSWGSFAPNGNYIVTWRDRRNTGKSDTVPFQIYGAISTDGGNTYSTNFLVSDSVSPAVTLIHGDDFLGCAASDSTIYALWSDMRTGKENTFFNATSTSKIITAVPYIDTPQDVSVEFHPNPFHDQTNLIINTALPMQNTTLQVFSIDGKKVDEQPIGEGALHTIRVSSLSTGTYIWSLVQGQKTLARGKWVIE